MYGIIIPNYWTSTKYDAKFRALIFLENHCTQILNTYEVFEDVVVDTVITIGSQAENDSFPKRTNIISISEKIRTHQERWLAIDNKNFVVNKILDFKSLNDSTLISFQNTLTFEFDKTLKDLVYFKKGMQPYEKGKGIPKQTRQMMNEKVYHSTSKINDEYKLLLKATNVQKFLIRGNSGFIKYGNNLAAKRNISIFRDERILMNRILSNKTIDAAYINEDDVINNSDIFNILPKSNDTEMLSILALITSKLCAFFFRSKNINLNRKAYPKLNVGTLEKFPIPDQYFEKTPTLSTYSSKIAQASNSLQEIREKFSRILNILSLIN